MNEQQKDFHERIANLLAHAKRLQEAAQTLMDLYEADPSETFDRNDDRLATTGTTSAGTQGAGAAVAVAEPTQSDVLTPDYVEQPFQSEVEDEQDEQDEQDERDRQDDQDRRDDRKEQAREAFNGVQDSTDNINDIVNGIDLDALLDDVQLDDSLSQ